jgi:hypothetical protein
MMFNWFMAYEQCGCRQAEQNNERQPFGAGHVVIEISNHNEADSSAKVRSQANVAVRLALVIIQDEALAIGYEYVDRKGNRKDRQLPEYAASPDGFSLSQLLLRHVLNEVLLLSFDFLTLILPACTFNVYIFGRP